jgi:hypothetical protein
LYADETTITLSPQKPSPSSIGIAAVPPGQVARRRSVGGCPAPSPDLSYKSPIWVAAGSPVRDGDSASWDDGEVELEVGKVEMAVGLLRHGSRLYGPI